MRLHFLPTAGTCRLFATQHLSLTSLLFHTVLFSAHHWWCEPLPLFPRPRIVISNAWCHRIFSSPIASSASTEYPAQTGHSRLWSRDRIISIEHASKRRRNRLHIAPSTMIIAEAFYWAASGIEPAAASAYARHYRGIANGCSQKLQCRRRINRGGRFPVSISISRGCLWWLIQMIFGRQLLMYATARAGRYFSHRCSRLHSAAMPREPLPILDHGAHKRRIWNK